MSHEIEVSGRNVVDTGEIKKISIQEYDATYKLPKKILKAVGFRTLMKDTKTISICWSIYFWFNMINVIVGVTMETISMFSLASEGTFLSLFTMMPCVGYVLVAITKVYKIKRYHYVYTNLVYELRGMWPQGIVTDEEYTITKEALDRLRFVAKAYFVCNMTLGGIFTVPPYISWVKSKMGYDEQLSLPFFYWLPFDPIRDVRYEIMVIVQTCHCFMAAGFMLSTDLLFFTFLSHISTQFSLLSIRINKLIYVPTDEQLIESYALSIYNKQNLENENSMKMNDEEQDREITVELVEIILRHKALIRLSADVEDMYSFSLLVNFMNSSIIICFCLFCCAFVEKWNEFLYKMFFLTAILQILILCWYGQKLLDTSTGIANSLYNCGWYLASSKIKKSILIMIHRSQKEVYVTTYGFSVICLESYSNILKTSWSYFTLLINVYKE